MAPGERSSAEQSLSHPSMGSFPGSAGGMAGYSSLAGPGGPYYPQVEPQEYGGYSKALSCCPPMGPHPNSYGGGTHPLLEMSASGHGYGEGIPGVSGIDSECGTIYTCIYSG